MGAAPRPQRADWRRAARRRWEHAQPAIRPGWRMSERSRLIARPGRRRGGGPRGVARRQPASRCRRLCRACPSGAWTTAALRPMHCDRARRLQPVPGWRPQRPARHRQRAGRRASRLPRPPAPHGLCRRAAISWTSPNRRSHPPAGQRCATWRDLPAPQRPPGSRRWPDCAGAPMARPGRLRRPVRPPWGSAWPARERRPCRSPGNRRALRPAPSRSCSAGSGRLRPIRGCHSWTDRADSYDIRRIGCRTAAPSTSPD